MLKSFIFLLYFLHLSSSLIPPGPASLPLMVLMIQQEFPNSTIHFDCNLNKLNISSQNDQKVIKFKNCQPQKILANKKFPKIFNDFTSTFLVSFEMDSKLKNFTSTEVQKIEGNFENFNLKFIILISEVAFFDHFDSDDDYDDGRYVGMFANYLMDSSRFTRLDKSKNTKFSLSNFFEKFGSTDISKMINDSLANNCGICLRILQFLLPNVYSKSLKIINGPDLQKLHCDIDCFRAVLSLPMDFDFSNIPEHLTLMLHEDFINSLREKTEHALDIKDNTTVPDFLEKYSIKMNLEGLTTLAFQQRQYKVLEFLIRADCPYPENFIIDKSNSRKFPQKNRFVQKLQNYRENIEKFHENVQNGDVYEVKKFLIENKHLKFARNEGNVSAMQVAFEHEHFEVFALLKGHGMALSSLEELAQHYEKVNALDGYTKTQIRRYNYKYLTPVAAEPNYIEKLIQQSKITFDSTLHNKSQLISEIRRALIEINQTSPEILKISAMSDDLTVIWDFSYTIVDEFEPGSDAVGITQRPFDYVVIGASYLLSNARTNRNYALGTTVHELMHYVMYLIYDNNAKPYVAHDLESKEKFRKFTEKCKLKEDLEPHLAYSNATEPDDFHIELIARVPDILMMNRHRPSHIKDIKGAFSELFDFYENKILVDIREMTATMRAREKVRKFNQWLDLLREIEEFEIEIAVKNQNFECDENGENSDEESSGYAQITDDEDYEFYYSGSGDHDDSMVTSKPENDNSDGSGYYTDDDNDNKILRSRRSTISSKLKSKCNQKKIANDNGTNIQDSNLKQKSSNYHYILDNLINNLGFGLSSNESRHMIVSNFPKTIIKVILNVTKESKSLAIFMKISSYLLDNFNKFMDEIGNLETDVLLVIDCDDIDNFKNFMEVLDSFSFRHVVFVADLKNIDDFDDQNLEIVKFEVNWTNLLPKSQQLLTEFKFYFQNDEMELGEIVGKQTEVLEKLPVEKIYSQEYYTIGDEPVSENEEFLVERCLLDVNGKEYGLNHLVLEVYDENNLKHKATSTFIISDIPGSGKSTILKELAHKIRELSPKFWVVYINLKQVDITMFDDDLVNFLVQTVLDMSEIDRHIFKHMLQQKRVALIFDEFDKIDENLQKNALKIFKNCKKQKLLIWIGTRASHEKVLKTNLKNSKIFKTTEFSKQDREKFSEFFDENLEENFLKFLEKIGNVGNPKMVQEIANIFENRENISNWHLIYSQLVFNKNFESSVELFESFPNDLAEAFSYPQKLLNAHQVIALYRLYGLKISSTFNLKLDAMNIPENFGIAYKTSTNRMEFVHESYACFFVSQYFIENLIKLELPQREFDPIWKLFMHATKMKSWRLVGKFMNDFLNINEIKLNAKRFSRIQSVLEATGISEN